VSNDKILNACGALMKEIEKHRAEIKQIKTSENPRDLYDSGYNKGIQRGLDAAVNIIRQFESKRYREITDALIRKTGQRSGRGL